MLLSEAKWFGEKIAMIRFREDIFPMLNMGSSTEHFRKFKQPGIDEYIFKPLRGRAVFHVDRKEEVGVDIVGDISDPFFRKGLFKVNPKSILCLNLLEHVASRHEICDLIISLVPIGGYIFVSCPYKFPFHADPIDTLFRPTPNELTDLFPETEIIFSDVVIGENYFDILTRNKLSAIKILIRMLLPIYKPQSWYTRAVYFPWLFNNFKTSCLVLRKI